MAKRIDVDDRLPPVRIPARVLHELHQHARESAPEECCGLVLRDGRERYGRVFRCQNIMTSMHEENAVLYPRDATAGFFMNPADILEVERGGEVVTAVYHSHVDAGAYLSELDIAYATRASFPYPEADQIVIEVLGDQVRSAGLFRPSAEADAEFVGHALEAEQPS